MVWSDTPPSEPGLYYVRLREDGEVQPGYFEGEYWTFMWPYEDWFPLLLPELYQFGPRMPSAEQLVELQRKAGEWDSLCDEVDRFREAFGLTSN
jgi:hypothetical protein